MDQAVLRERESKCTQEQPPKCTAQCPVHVDVKAVLKCIEKGELEQAYKLYAKSVPFPQLISRICEAPCEAKCLRNELDQSIQIQKLEQYLTETIGLIDVKTMVPPAKAQKVAIIGSGIGGMTTAKVLRMKGYGVSIYERMSQAGGKLLQIGEVMLLTSILEYEVHELSKLGIELNLCTAVGDAISFESLQEIFDAIYIDCSEQEAAKWLPSASILKVDPFTLSVEMPQTEGLKRLGVFGGGSLIRQADGYRPIESVSEGKRAANSIDRYLQGVSLTGNRTGEGSQETLLYTAIESERVKQAVVGSGPFGSFNAGEAASEAGRCIQCECLECVKACTYMQHYKGYPKRYFREIYNNMSIVMGIHYANKMINSCSQCGQCAHICPNDADMSQMTQDARLHMVASSKMPPSAHDFPLRDMAFSTSKAFRLFKNQPGFETSNYVFFPGCQLAASSPEQVKAVYHLLCEELTGGVGLMLDCCGAPAKWAGRMDLLEPVLNHLEQVWQENGKALFITACPSCKEMFRAYLPQIEVKMLYPLLENMKLPVRSGAHSGQTLAIHDSCSTRFDEALQESIRRLLTQMGYTTLELKYTKDKTSCCGYGGLMMFANPEVSKLAIHNRICESEKDYVSYCAMCRDNFAQGDKKSWHILDLIFESDLEVAGTRPSPDFSTRHDQRAKLKRQLLQTLWGESVQEGVAPLKIKVKDEIRIKMASRNILMEDLREVLSAATETQNIIWHPEKACHVAYHQSGAVTYWVEYLQSEEGEFEVLNTYSHRLIIEV